MKSRRPGKDFMVFGLKDFENISRKSMIIGHEVLENKT